MELRSGCGCLIATYPDPVPYVVSAIGNPKEKIRIEPVETPVPAKTPEPVEVPEKEPVS